MSWRANPLIFLWWAMCVPFQSKEAFHSLSICGARIWQKSSKVNSSLCWSPAWRTSESTRRCTSSASGLLCASSRRDLQEQFPVEHIASHWTLTFDRGHSICQRTSPASTVPNGVYSYSQWIFSALSSAQGHSIFRQTDRQRNRQTDRETDREYRIVSRNSDRWQEEKKTLFCWHILQNSNNPLASIGSWRSKKRPQTRPPLWIPAVRTLDFSHLNICPMAVLLMTPDPSVSYM